MNWTEHPILCLHRSQENPWGRFMDEVLIQEGYLCHDSVDLDRAGDISHLLDGRALLIVTPPIAGATRIHAISQYVKQGGRAILVRPPAEMIEALGLSIEEVPGGYCGAGAYTSAPPGYLEFSDHPWVSHHAGRWIQCHVPTLLWKIGGARSLAQYGCRREVPSAWPSIIEVECGNGRIAIFWFDPGASLVLTRQGDPRLASSGSGPDADADGMHKSAGLFHGHLDFHLRAIPQADALADGLVGIIRGLTDPVLEIPRLWHLPEDAPALTLLDGDSDGFRWDHYDRLIAPCMEAGIPFTLNVHPADFPKFDPSASERIFAVGNDLELHYWAGSPLATVAEAARQVPEQHRGFRKLSGGRSSVGSRGHSLIWPGYTEMAEILAKEGFRLETNFIAFRGCQCGYVNGSGRAARFMTSDGRFLPISQQSTVLMDDAVFTPKSLLPPMTPDQAYQQTLRFFEESVRHHHGVVSIALHPGQYGSHGAGYSEGMTAIRAAVLKATRDHRLPARTVRDWVDFQEARRQMGISYDGNHWRLKAAQPIRGLTCHFPSKKGSHRQGLDWESHTMNFQAGEWRALKGMTETDTEMERDAKSKGRS